MCQAISLILTEKKVIRIPGVESHDEIMVLSGVDDTSWTPDFVKVELLPPDSDDPETWLDWRRWLVSWDQDNFPDWFVENVDKERVYTWAEKHARVVKDARIVTGNIDLLAGQCGRVVGLCTIAWCVPGTALQHGGRAIVKHGGGLWVVYGGRISVKCGDNMRVVYGDAMNVEYGHSMSVVYGDYMSVEHGDHMSVVHGCEMIARWGGNMTVENLEYARILDRETG